MRSSDSFYLQSAIDGAVVTAVIEDAMIRRGSNQSAKGKKR